MKKKFDPANVNAEGVVFKHKAKDKNLLYKFGHWVGISLCTVATIMALFYAYWMWRFGSYLECLGLMALVTYFIWVIRDEFKELAKLK